MSEMVPNDMSPLSWPWFLAEGFENGKPSLFRGRQIPQEFLGHAKVPCILVVSYRFEAHEESGLPSRDQYEKIDLFERSILFDLEHRRLGVVAYIKTCNGIIKYVCYVADIDDAMAVFSTHDPCELELAFAAGADPNWREYSAFLDGVSREEPNARD